MDLLLSMMIDIFFFFFSNFLKQTIIYNNYSQDFKNVYVVVSLSLSFK